MLFVVVGPAALGPFEQAAEIVFGEDGGDGTVLIVLRSELAPSLLENVFELGAIGDEIEFWEGGLLADVDHACETLWGWV